MTDHLREAIPRRARFAHRSFRSLLIADLKQRQRQYRDQGHNETADTLARITKPAPGVASFVRQIERSGPHGYYWPTIAAELWRISSIRRRLQRRPRYAAALAAYRWAAHNEAAARAVLAADVLCWIAEAVTQTDEHTKREIDKHKRKFEEQRSVYQLLGESGRADAAQPNLTEAVKHLVISNNLKRADRNDLLIATRIKLKRLFGLGYGIAAELVGAALDEGTFLWHTRYVVKKNKR
jgi:hypothetical protein